MKIKSPLNVTVLTVINLALGWGLQSAVTQAQSPIQTPVLKWQHKKGCYASWCETGWYSSSAVADLDGDGSPQAIVNTVQLNDGLGHVLQRQATVIVDGLATYLPIVTKGN